MAVSQKERAALAFRRVLDLADEKGAYCTRLLAGLGAEVIKVERPEGDATRRLGPFKDDIPHPERSLHFFYYNVNKRSITLNLECTEGQSLFRRLVSTADIVIETFQPGYLQSLGLGYPALREINPKLIMTSITGFGQTGPYRDYKAPDIVGFAMSGAMYLSGEPNKTPCVAPGNLACAMASVYATVGTFIALRHREMTGEGQHIDISMQESTALGTDFSIPSYSYQGYITKRLGSTSDRIAPCDSYPCVDGHVRFVVIVQHHWREFRKWIGEPEALLDPAWDDRMFRVANIDVINPYIIEFAQNYTKQELYHEGQRRHLPVTPVNTPADFVNDTQARARGFFVEVEHPEVGRGLFPWQAHKLGETPCRVERPAPLLGQDNEAIYCQELGLTKEELIILSAAGAI